MDTAANVRSPKFDPFWGSLKKRLLATARKICAGCRWPLKSEPEDFAQDALLVAIRFTSRRVGSRRATLELLQSLEDDAFRYARAAMKHDFLDEVRLALHRHHYCEANTPHPRESQGTSWWGRMRIPTPEDFARAATLVRQMSQGSQSPKNKAIARAAHEVAKQGGEHVNGKDITALAGVSSSDLADFRRMAAKRGFRPGTHNDEV